MNYLYTALLLLIALVPAGGGLWVIGRMRSQRLQLRFPFSRTQNIGRWLIGLGLLAISALTIVGSIHLATALDELTGQLSQISSPFEQETTPTPLYETPSDVFDPELYNCEIPVADQDMATWTYCNQ